jgi:DNA primase
MNASSETWQLGNQAVQVSHLEKVYWPQTGFAKGDLLHYYQQIAPVILPYFKDRPVTLRVFPQGVEGVSYYLRDCPEDAPDWLRRVPYRPKTVSHPVPLPLIDTAAGLLWFANQGAIEFHLWGSHTPNLTQPDLAIFDLDPGETAAPYTLRAHPVHPTVSTPLTWEELDRSNIQPASLTPQAVLERVGRVGDLFAPVLQEDQHIA